MVEEATGEVYNNGRITIIYFEGKLVVGINREETKAKIYLIDLSENAQNLSPGKKRILEVAKKLRISEPIHTFQIDGYRLDQITSAVAEKRKEDYTGLVKRILDEEDILT